MTFPYADHPLTKMYLAAAKASTHDQMRAAMDMSRSVERMVNPQTIAACKLAAEVISERASMRHGYDLLHSLD